jgi:L-seryl-tRNA(Ser) seleniumtransferase
MAAEVLEAMAQAAGANVDMAELQAGASRVIARCTGAEAGIVTSGAAAALTLGMAACLTGLDIVRMERLPDTQGIPNEVVVPRTHRTGYDHAIRAAGARLVEVGFNDRGTGAGVRDVEAWEIEAAITPRTAALAYTATPASRPPLAEVAALGERHRLPVLVDAAAQLPPRENLRRFLGEGATLVAFSGGKAIRGPQSSGILCGRRDLIAAAALQMLDMDVAPETWQPPETLIPLRELKGIPHHGLGRGFKVGKEEIVGLIVALERFVALDPEAEEAAWLAGLRLIAERLEAVAHVSTRLFSGKDTGRFPLLELALHETELGLTAWDVSRALQRGGPPVHLSERRASEGVLTVNPAGLREGDAEIVAARLLTVLAAPRRR